jgi:hypothetical protein
MRASREVLMRRKRFTEEQIAYALRQAEFVSGPARSICNADSPTCPTPRIDVRGE